VSTAHLAQLNVAHLAAPLDSPQLADFVNALDEINALGESSPGFVWRLVGDGNDATGLRPFPDPEMIVNLTVWADKAALEAFAYRTGHAAFLRRRREWFTPMDSPAVVLWHVPKGHVPTLGEARARLEHLTARGPSPYAFGFRGTQPVLTIERTPLGAPVAGELIGELNAELAGRYETGNHFRLDADEVAEGTGAYVVASLDGEPAACGAIRRLGDDRAEIKRMYTRPGFQGRGLGGAVLSHLEGIARDLAVSELVLETGPLQPEALRVYERAGFTRCDCWGEYLDTPDTSLCMAKSLG
jgi:GNAT superfamily N-acetyltransferase